ncbi:hypothetical protein H8959_006204 [Pygathrix nigripes]
MLGTGRETPGAEVGGARRAPASPDLSAAGRRGRSVTRGRGVGPDGRGRGGAGRGGFGAGPGSAGRPETRREPHASGRLAVAAAPAIPAAAATTRTRLRPGERQQPQPQQPPLQLERQQQRQPQQQPPRRAALGGRALLKEAARPPPPPPPACSCPRGPRERHGPRTPGGQLPGARRGPGPRRPAPLPARPPGALGSVLRPLRARPGCRPRCPRPAARCLPLRPHRPTRRHRCPGGPPLAWGSPQPAPRPTPGRSSALALAGGAAPGVAGAQRPGGPGGRSHPGGPGSPRGGGTVGPGDRGPAAADGGRPQRAVRAAGLGWSQLTCATHSLGAQLSAEDIPCLSSASWSQVLDEDVTSKTWTLAQRQEEQQRHRPSPWRVLYNLIMGLLPLPRGHRAPEMEPN